jgi:hypothetical protein
MGRYITILTFLILFLILSLSHIDSGWSQEMKIKERIISAFTGRVPKEWGERVRGGKNKTQHRPESVGIDL